MASSPEPAQPGTTVPSPATPAADPSPPVPPATDPAPPNPAPPAQPAADPSPPPSPLPEASPPPPVQPASPPPVNPVPPTPLPPSPPTTTTPTPSTTPVQTPPQAPPQENAATPALPGSPPLTSPPPMDGNGSVTPPPSASFRVPPRARSKHGHSPSLADDNEMAAILGIILGGVVTLTIIILCLRWWRKRRRGRRQYSLDRGADPYHKGSYHHHQKVMEQHYAYKIPPSPGGWGISPPPQVMGHSSSEFSYSGQHPVYAQTPPQSVGGFGAQCEFTYEALEAATAGFCKANLLGQGGFGFVHKGVLPNGKEVAVKSLKSGSGQGEREFQAEVEIISRVHHRHLVSLVGYCIAGSQRMLVYEFVPNNTLEFHLHGKDQPVMDWAVRRRIAVGAAKGLAYLHEDCHPRIIHRDIKAANILLDNNFEAMVADFGLAKLTSDNHTHVSTRVMGTFGYLAPEYAASGKLTEKSDVFSYGVMLLELITGHRPLDPANIMEDSLVDWARPAMAKALDTGDYTEVVDPRLEGKYVPQEMARMISCAAASTRHSARRRPRMSQIVRALEGNSSFDDFNEGVKPGQSAVYNPYDTSAYNADMVKFRKMVMTSEEFTSGTTSTEYGLNASSAGSSSCGDSREIGSTPSPHQNHPKQ